MTTDYFGAEANAKAPASTAAGAPAADAASGAAVTRRRARRRRRREDPTRSLKIGCLSGAAAATRPAWTRAWRIGCPRYLDRRARGRRSPSRRRSRRRPWLRPPLRHRRRRRGRACGGAAAARRLERRRRRRRRCGGGGVNPGATASPRRRRRQHRAAAAAGGGGGASSDESGGSRSSSVTRSRAGSSRCRRGRASERCWRRHPPKTQRGVRQRTAGRISVSSSPAGLRPAVSPAVAAPALSPSAADYHSCLPGVATRPGRGGGGSGGAGLLAQAASASLFADYFAGREVAQAGVSTSGAVRRRGARRAASSAASPPPPPLAVRRVQLLASEMREGDGGRLHTVYRVRASAVRVHDVPPFSAFLELHCSLNALPASAKLPRSRRCATSGCRSSPTSTPRGGSGCPKSTSTSCARCPRRARAPSSPPSSGPRPATARSSRPTGRRGRSSR